MAIHTYCSPETPGAFCWWPSSTSYLRKPEEPRADGGYYRKEPADDPCLHTLGVGTTVRTWERNGYDDSDFFAEYYNTETGKFEVVEYATTRGWTYTATASVDATPEIFALYAEHTRRLERAAKARELRAGRKAEYATARKCGLTVFAVRKLRNAIPRDYRDAVFTLLGVKKFRSGFRESLAKQVRAWLTDPAPRFGSPLSSRQLSFLH